MPDLNFFGGPLASPSNYVAISLFPIPGSVAMPYSMVPLHVFEPRYRKMILESIAEKRRIGVCHTKRQISPPKTASKIDLAEYLNHNQESYEPQTVFSAGFAELLETLDDGRMVVQVTMDGRYKFHEVLQEIPYKIVSCSLYSDTSLAATLSFRISLDLELLDLCEKNQPALKTYIESPEWKELSNEEYSYAIYSLVILDPDMLQIVLKLQSIDERILFLKDFLIKHYLM